ncbi:MAG: DUF971 domain-containing protein [Candidatus Marinimicrobia bacterium]|nr:DUF971 domain-containing protein [Candidatus Neomarinimicrobiota bacterium]
MSDLVIKNYDVINDILIIKWEGDAESYIPLKKLRENCPCAGCAGESDVFGNVFKGKQPKRSEVSFQLTNLKLVGYYAVQPFWGDRHNTGIYRYELLQSLGEGES